MKKVILMFILIIGVMLLGNKAFNTSFAYQYDVNNLVLFYKDNHEELALDIKNYLENVDNIIIPNSSFLYSEKLVDNYDFLVHFAIDYVLNNKEYYSKSINSLSNCSYIDKLGMSNDTLDYVNLDIVYDITDFYFGIRDFTVINDDVCLVDNYISLSDYVADEFKLEITNVFVVNTVEGIDALVYYEGGSKYKYSFYNENNILKLKNVEVEL